jgi:hypothetical protein
LSTDAEIEKELNQSDGPAVIFDGEIEMKVGEESLNQDETTDFIGRHGHSNITNTSRVDVEEVTDIPLFKAD